MSRSWNGESLVDELSALLGDTSAAFKTRVLGWLNDVIFDISNRHDWGFHLTKGKKFLVQSEEIQSLEISAPEAPLIALVSGGSLTENSTYKALVTFCQDNGAETISGTESAAVTATSADKSIKLSDIPTCSESLITKRKIYLDKDGEGFFYHSTIEDDFTTTLTLSTETDSTIEPPDYETIRRLKGSPFFEASPSIYLTYKDIDQLRLLIQGQWSEGSPEYFSPIESNSITLYPLPASDYEVSFNYYRYPFRLYNSASSQPDLPIYLKPALKAGVVALGYEYRDRDGTEVKKANYENAVFDAINRGARVANVEYTVRDVYGNFNGFEVS
jgi:hypothetical protein